MRHFVLTLIIGLFALTATSQTMGALWSAMPDSVVPYLDATQRQQMAGFLQMGLESDIPNHLNGKSVIDSLTEDFMDVRLNASSRLQLRRLPSTDGDSILCMVRTFDDAESTVDFYTLAWQPLSGCFDPTWLTDAQRYFATRPDTMRAETYDSLLAQADPAMVKVMLSPDKDDLELTLTVPLVEHDAKEALNALIVTRKLKWNGERFK